MRSIVALAACAMTIACTAGVDHRVADLERQLRERDREIAQLRQYSQIPNPPTSRSPAEPPAPLAAPSPPPADAERSTDVPEDLSHALERALVRQGGLVLPPASVQIEPEIAYTYSEPGGRRRDTFTSAVTLRAGMPWALQAEVYVPYVLYDRRAGKHSSGTVGDVNVGLVRRLLSERERVPELLATVRWKTRTGTHRGDLPTGTGAYAVQGLLTAVKRHDPLVLFGSVSYIHNFNVDDVHYGDVVGTKLGLLLAATPDTSVQLDVDVNSNFATRVGGFAIADSDRLSGIVELGVARVLTRGLFFDLTAGIGFTSAAPDFRLAASLPFTWY
jgi:hypothetical protein